MAAVTPVRTRRAPAPAGSGAPARVRLSIVRPPSRHSHGRWPRPLWLALAFVFLSLLAVGAAHAYLVAGQVRLAHLQQQLDTAQNSERGLEVQVARLEDPAQVVTQGEQQGLSAPTQVTDLPLVAPTSAPRPAPRPAPRSSSSSSSGTRPRR